MKSRVCIRACMYVIVRAYTYVNYNAVCMRARTCQVICICVCACACMYAYVHIPVYCISRPWLHLSVPVRDAVIMTKTQHQLAETAMHRFLGQHAKDTNTQTNKQKKVQNKTN